MTIKVDSNSFLVFDLDDTLYLEIDFLKSAYRSISKEVDPDSGELLFNDMLQIYLNGGNAFAFLLEKYPHKNLTVEKLVSLYRNHNPVISLREGVLAMMTEIKKKDGKIGIITDGRYITQSNKIKALGLDPFIDKVVISEEFGYEKPNPLVFESFMHGDINRQYYYFGDNFDKDFIAPLKLSWFCIGVLDDRNIHKQNLSGYSAAYLPDVYINKFTEIRII